MRKKIRLLLDSLVSPYDMANIFQVALATGSCKLYLSGKSLNHKHPKVESKLKSWHVKGEADITYFATFDKAANKLHKEGYNLIGTSPSAKKSFYELDLSKNNEIMVFGPESGGLSKEKKKYLDDLVKIPMASDLEFMTLSVAVPIIVYEIFRQRIIEDEALER